MNTAKKEITPEDIEEAKGETNESLGVTFAIGAALSAGKLTSLVGSGLEKLGKK